MNDRGAGAAAVGALYGGEVIRGADGLPIRVGPYIKGPDCLECLKDLSRLLHREKNYESKDFFKKLGSWNVVKNDLIPLLTTYREPEHHKLSYQVCVLLTKLTMPPQPSSYDIPLQIQYLQDFKEAFLINNGDPIAVLMILLSEPLSREDGERTEEDNQFIEMLLSLFKNLLAIPDKPLSASISQEQKTHLQDEFIMILDKEHVLELFIVLAQSCEKEENNNFSFLISDLICLLLRRESPRQLIQTVIEENQEKEKRKTGEKGKLSALLEQEKQRKSNTSSRTQLRGAFVSKTQTGRNIIFKNLVANANANFVPKPVLKHVGRKPQALKSDNNQGSSVQVRCLLKDWVDRFLENASYITLMKSLNEKILESTDPLKILNDKMNYFWLIKFFSGYCAEQAILEANHEIDISTIAVVLSYDQFQFLTNECQIYLDEKNWSAVAGCVGAMKEILKVLKVLYTSNNKKYESISATLQNKIWYNNLLLENLPALIKAFNPTKQSKSYLIDLIEIVDLCLSLLDLYSINRPIIQQKKKRQVSSTSAKKRKKTNKSSKKEKDIKQHEDGVEKDEKCPEDEIKEKMEEEKEPENKKEKKGEIEEENNKKEKEELKSSNEEKETEKEKIEEAEIQFENKNLETQKEKIEEDFFEEGKKDVQKIVEALEKEQEKNQDNVQNAKEEDQNYSEEEEEGEEDKSNLVMEKVIDVQDYICQYLVSPLIISNYCLLLKEWKKNPSFINDMIFHFFDQMRRKTPYEPMLYQISVLKLFAEIIQDPESNQPKMKDLVNLMKATLQSFLKNSSQNRELLLLMFTWKKKSECFHFDFSIYSQVNFSSNKIEDSEKNEMRAPISTILSTEKEKIMKPIQKFKEQKNEELDIIPNPQVEWTQEEDDILTTLFFENKASGTNSIHFIWPMMEGDKSDIYVVYHRLLTLGLIDSKSFPPPQISEIPKSEKNKTAKEKELKSKSPEKESQSESQFENNENEKENESPNTQPKLHQRKRSLSPKIEMDFEESEPKNKKRKIIESESQIEEMEFDNSSSLGIEDNNHKNASEEL